MLERLNQLESATSPPAVLHARHLAHTPASAVADHDPASSNPALAVGVVLLLMVAVGTYVVVSSRGEWRPWSPLADGRATSTSAPAVREVAFSVPTAGEMAVASARSRMSRGDLHAALATLERVRPTDPVKGEADRLRAVIQRELLRSGSDGSPDSGAGDSSR